MSLTEMLGLLSGAVMVACAASGLPPQPAAAAPGSATPVSSPSATAELIRQAWQFDDAKGTEQRFRQLSEEALARGDVGAALELETQVARAQGFDRRFEEANATLAGVEAKLVGQPASVQQPVVRVRLLLEQGRVLNSSKQPVAARPLFEQALELARAEQLDGLAVDAAHMIAITLQDQPDEAISWNEKALAMARASTREDGRRWLGSLLNNQGWSYYEKQDYPRALQLFEEALEYRLTQDNSQPNNAQTTRIAKWCVAKTLRTLGQTQRALEMQQALLAEYASIGKGDGFVLEELGECYYALGDAARAQEYFAQAFAELSKDADFVENEAPRLERMRRLGGVL